MINFRKILNEIINGLDEMGDCFDLIYVGEVTRGGIEQETSLGDVDLVKNEFFDLFNSLRVCLDAIHMGDFGNNNAENETGGDADLIGDL